MAGDRIGVVIPGPNRREFKITEFVGAGAFGEVYRAEERGGESIAAVKFLPLPGVPDPSFKQALLNEAEMATHVSHPNVVNVFHAGETEETGPYVLMEYVSGQTLDEFLTARAERGAQIPFGKAIEMMLHIAEGMRAINKSLVHRDVKPDNILLAGEQLKIGDFGLSKLVAERTRTKTFKGIGPIRYMAPEAWQLSENTAKMDVYSVGLVFHEILTLQHPLMSQVTDASHIEAWRRAHLFESPCDIRSVRGDTPRPLTQLLSRMVTKRAPDRPEWDEVISILSSVGVDTHTPEGVSTIVEKAISARDRAERERLAQEGRRATAQEAEQLYEVAFKQLIARWDAIVDSFNAQFQGDTITKIQRSARSCDYVLPKAPTITVSLFDQRETGVKIAGGDVAGGGVIGLESSKSANMVLIRESPSDLYGRWIGCLVRVSAMVVREKSLARLCEPPADEPFGFQTESDFYGNIKWVGGGIHIFTYELREDLGQLFRELLDAAYST